MSPVSRYLLSVALLAASTVHAQALDYDHQESWKAVHDEPQDIRLNNVRAALDVVDNGHAVEVEAKGPDAIIRGRHFKLLQFHFHAESEHTLDGKHFPLEGHFVFRAADGRLAVVGVMYREGPANPLAAKVLAALEKEGHGELSKADIAQGQGLLPLPGLADHAASDGKRRVVCAAGAGVVGAGPDCAVPRALCPQQPEIAGAQRASTDPLSVGVPDGKSHSLRQSLNAKPKSPRFFTEPGAFQLLRCLFRRPKRSRPRAWPQTPGRRHAGPVAF
jgi:hypothetical protein